MSLVFAVPNFETKLQLLTCAMMLSIIIRAGPRGIVNRGGGASQAEGWN